MKKFSLTSGMLLFCLAAFGQDAKELLKQSYNQCQSVQNGYYEMTKYMKYMSENDTSKMDFKCSFKKLKDDSVYSSAFHYNVLRNDTSLFDVIYTGDDFAATSGKDSTVTIMSKKMWAKEIKLFAHNYTFYSPLTNKESSPLQHDSDFTDNRHVFTYLGTENLNGFFCHHIKVNYFPENDSNDAMQFLREEYEYWIRKDDMIPVQYSIAFDFVMNNDTMYQYEKFVLNKYEINNLIDENILTLNSIPSYYKIKDYVPYKSPEPLKEDTMAPDWELFSLTGEKISLKSLQGQLVLIDFFYKSCYPCMLALPGLQTLHEKYNDKGLRVVGIDPYDKKEDDIASFLAKRGVTYTVLLGGADAAKDYHVSGYPTMYLIDKTGKIIFTQVGYGKGVEDALEEMIKTNLNNEQ